MAREPNKSESTANWLERLTKLNEVGLVIAAACYITGFLVATIYLGSYGIQNFDVLRAKYILTGIFFLGYFAVIMMPLYGFLRSAARYYRKSFDSITGIFLAHLVLLLLASPYILIGLSILFSERSGSLLPLNGAFALPSVQPDIFVWYEWLFSMFVYSVTLALFFFFTSYLMAVLFLMSRLLAYPVVRSSLGSCRWFLFVHRTAVRRTKYLHLKGDGSPALQTLFSCFLLAFSLLLCKSLLEWVTFGQADEDVLDFFSATDFVQTFLQSTAWVAFVASAVLLNVVFSLLFLAIIGLAQNVPKPHPKQRSPKTRPFGLLLPMAGLGIIPSVILLFVYAHAVYPHIPQQFGGGKGVPVILSLKEGAEELAPQLAAENYQVFLLERNSSSAYVLVLPKYQETSPTPDIANIPEGLPTTPPQATTFPVAITATQQTDLTPEVLPFRVPSSTAELNSSLTSTITLTSTIVNSIPQTAIGSPMPSVVVTGTHVLTPTIRVLEISNSEIQSILYLPPNNDATR